MRDKSLSITVGSDEYVCSGFVADVSDGFVYGHFWPEVGDLYEIIISHYPNIKVIGMTTKGNEYEGAYERKTYGFKYPSDLYQLMCEVLYGDRDGVSISVEDTERHITFSCARVAL